MRHTRMITGTVVVIFIVMAVALSILSRQKEAPGLVDGRLMSCPDTPNCVCSEYPANQAFVEPLGFEGNSATAWSRVTAAVRDSGGKIVREEGDYLAATYTSKVFRFIDDLELRLDSRAGHIHVRSASRVGHSDLGVNRKRVEKLRKLYLEAAEANVEP
ncbi:MAG: DUF1499 domain-containing protein [Pseudomonadota bacterium]